MSIIEESSDWNFIACIPHKIQAEWDDTFALILAGFPVNLTFTRICQPKNENEPPQIIWSCYQFVPSTFHENSNIRRMTYSSRANPNFRVEVAIDKHIDEIEVSKFRGETFLWQASGATFDLAMTHATMMGMEADEMEEERVAEER